MSTVTQVAKQIQQGEMTVLDLKAGVVVPDDSGVVGGYRTERIWTKLTCYDYTIRKVQAQHVGQIVVQYQYSKNSVTKHRVVILNGKGEFIRQWKPTQVYGEGETNGLFADIWSLPGGQVAIRGGNKGGSSWITTVGDLGIVRKEADAKGTLLFSNGNFVMTDSTNTIYMLDKKNSKKWTAPSPVTKMIPFNGGVVAQGIKRGDSNEVWFSFLNDQLACLSTSFLTLPSEGSLEAWDVTELGKCLALVKTTQQTKVGSIENYEIYCEDANERFSPLFLVEGGKKGCYRTQICFSQFQLLSGGYFVVVFHKRHTRTDGVSLVSAYTPDTQVILRILCLEDKTTVFEKSFTGKTAAPFVVVGPQGEYFILDGKDIKICNLEQREIKKIFLGHTQQVTSVVVLSEGYFASTSKGECVTKIWDIERGVCVQTLSGVTGELIAGPEGNLIVNSKDGYLTICDSPIPKRAARGHEFQPIWDALAENKTITKCYLRGLPLHDEGVVGLAESLKKNRTITWISLRETGITDVGAKKLLESVTRNGKINFIGLTENVISPPFVNRLKDRISKNKRAPVVATTTTTTSMTFNIPNELYCPITMLIMQDPVMATDGHTYEREAIEEWLQTNQTSPKTGASLSSKEVLPIWTIRGQISSLHDQYPTLIHSGDVYLSKRLKDEMLNAALAGDVALVGNLVAKDPRLLTEPMQVVGYGLLPESLFSFALRKGPVALLKKVVQLLGPEGIKKYIVETGDEGVSFFRKAARELGAEGAKCIGQALGWNGADYEDELFEAIGREDLPLIDVCLGLGVPLDVTDKDGDSLLHCVLKKDNATLIMKMLSLGVSTKVPNAKGQTPQELAEAEGRADLALLIETKKQEVKVKELLDPLKNRVLVLEQENQELKKVVRLVGQMLQDSYGAYANGLPSADKVSRLAALYELADKLKTI